MRRLAALFAGSLMVALLPWTATISAASAASGACTSDSGVTVVIDYGSLGGGIVARCATTSGTGLDALRAAGFSIEGTQKDGPAFVCRIDGKPSVAKEKCVNTPPREAYWSYWLASDGGSWKYSQSAASNRKVVQGGFEGWRFGSGTAPGILPQRAGAAAGGSKSGGANDSNGSSADGSGTIVAPTGPGSADGESLPKPKPRTVESPAATPGAQPTPSEQESSTATKSVSATSADSGHSVAPWLAGGIVLLLIAAAVLTQRRRRSS